MISPQHLIMRSQLNWSITIWYRLWFHWLQSMPGIRAVQLGQPHNQEFFLHHSLPTKLRALVARLHLRQHRYFEGHKNKSLPALCWYPGQGWKERNSTPKVWQSVRITKLYIQQWSLSWNVHGLLRVLVSVLLSGHRAVRVPEEYIRMNMSGETRCTDMRDAKKSAWLLSRGQCNKIEPFTKPL